MATVEQISQIVAVQVWGLDAEGTIFRESVQAREFSETGALLDGVRPRLMIGDVLGVGYEGQKARARVMRIAASSFDRQVCDVQLLESSLCPWKDCLSPDSPANSRAAERRRFPRYRLPLGLELRPASGIGAPLHVKTTDVSAGGCYIETMLPLGKGTELRVSIWLEVEKLTTEGVVRTSDPAVGMGIEFQGLTAGQVATLEQFMRKHAA
jgi:hypothetical protein